MMCNNIFIINKILEALNDDSNIEDIKDNTSTTNTEELKLKYTELFKKIRIVDPFQIQ